VGTVVIVGVLIGSRTEEQLIYEDNNSTGGETGNSDLYSLTHENVNLNIHPPQLRKNN
jgi:hypothetical protein